MSLIASATTASAASLKNVGDSVAGRITGIEDYQLKEFGGTDLQFRKDKNGNFILDGNGQKIPQMGVRITLETEPGNASSATTLWVEKWRMVKAIGAAVVQAGASDIEVGGDLAVTFVGYEGRAKTFSAAYAKPEAE